MTLRDIAVAFGYEVDAASERKAESSIRGLKNLANKLLGSIAVYFTVKGISDLAQAGADAEALNSQFSQVFGDMEKTATDALQSVADEAGAMTNRMKSSFTQLAAFTKTTGASAEEALTVAERGMRAAADSAAFYDRSLEDVTNSLQSFLKGNYANDAALGLSCTEITRNAAANELYGKSFMNLTEYQKQMTLLKMVEDANKMSGALGQAARESDTWTNQLGNLKQSITDFKAAAGNSFLKPAISALKFFTSLVQKATVGIKKLTSETGLLTRAANAIHALVKRIQPTAERMIKVIVAGFKKLREILVSVTNKLGGLGNTIKLVTVLAVGFMVAIKWNKLISGAKAFTKVFALIGKIFSVATLKILAVVAAVAALALLVEDFVHFLLGNESLIGGIFDKTGVGADNARKAIFDAWKKIKAFLLEVWDFLKKAATMTFDTIKDFFVRHLESIRANFERAWGIIKRFLNGVWTFISQLADTLFGKTEDNINGKQMSTKEKMLAVWKKILDVVSAIWDAIYETASTVFNAIAAVVEKVMDWIKMFWDKWGADVLAFFKNVFGAVSKVFHGVLDVIKGIANFVSSIFKGEWKSAWEAIKNIFVGIWDVIVGVVIAAWEAIKLVFTVVLGFLKALWEKIWGAICSFFKAIWNNIVDFFKGIIDSIKRIVSPVTNFFKNVFQKAWDGICKVFSRVGSFFKGIWNTITGIFATIGETIGGAISGAVKSAVNGVLGFAVKIINGFISAINVAIGVINAIPGVEIKKLQKLETPKLAKGGIATRETEAIIGEGAEPEAVLPLSKLGGMISGYIKAAKESEAGKTVSALIKSATQALSSCVAAFRRAKNASPNTASMSTSNRNWNIVQNVDISNTYNGGDREVQRNVSTAMKKSAVDATTQMARALAYGR